MRHVTSDCILKTLNFRKEERKKFHLNIKSSHRWINNRQKNVTSNFSAKKFKDGFETLIKFREKKTISMNENIFN